MTDEPQHEDDSNQKRWIIVAGLLGIVVIGGLAFARIALQVFKMPTGSMMPTYEAGTHIVVNKWGEPSAGEAVVFRFAPKTARDYLSTRTDEQRECIDPATLNRDEPDMFIKRIVAFGGQKVSIRGHKLLVDGEAVSGDVVERIETEDFLQSETLVVRETIGSHAYRIRSDAEAGDFGPFDVPEDHVFVLGDNRSRSSDSRCWGPVPVENVEGTVVGTL